MEPLFWNAGVLEKQGQGILGFKSDFPASSRSFLSQKNHDPLNHNPRTLNMIPDPTHESPKK